MTYKINYDLRGGYWAPKDEIKEAFYSDLYHFINERYDTELKKIPLADFIVSEPYIIGNTCGKYYLKEEVGGKVENQPTDYFIGYCWQNHKYRDLIPHLIHFFALWREIERCMELHATDFFNNSWASLVDTAKFFKYTTVEDLKKSPEAPSVQDERILYMLQNCPGLYQAPETVGPEDQRLPKPKRDRYEFIGWYDNPEYKGSPVKYAAKDLKQDATYYAKWATHTFFHANDGYATFDDLYEDFLRDFSQAIGKPVGKTMSRVLEHGWVSEFCTASFQGGLDKFYAIPENYQKWYWLIEYLKSRKTDETIRSRFNFKNGKFGLEAQVRWELNSLFVSRFHLVWPTTSDYSGIGIKEKLADSTNSRIDKVKYPVGDLVKFPKFERKGFQFGGWYDNPKCEGNEILEIHDDHFAAKTLYAKWVK